jgi:Trypsin-like serine proteases, typically periplasmic, contain C-terminal PDZ domain
MKLTRKMPFARLRLVSSLSIAAILTVSSKGALSQSLGEEQPTPSWEETVQAANSSSVVFITFSGKQANGLEDPRTGTGFIVSADGFFITCSHVLPPTKEYTDYKATVVIGARQGTEYYLDVDDFIDRLENLDLVLFRLPDVGTPWHSIQRTKMKATAHTPILGLGFPLNEGLVYAKGEITSLHAKKAIHWLTDAALNRGMSGGPVFDRTGAVVAIVAAGQPAAQRISELIPIGCAKRFLEDYGSPVLTQQNQAVQQVAENIQKTTEKVEKIEDTLSKKELNAEQSAKADDLLQKAAKSKENWDAAYNKFVEINRTKPGRKSISERQDVVIDLKDAAKEYHATTKALARIVDTAPNTIQ